MAVIPEDLLASSFPLVLEDSLEKCQYRRSPVLLYHEHWVDAVTKEYHVDVFVKANDSPTSWFFEGPRMETLALAVETAACKALIHLRDIIPEMADEPATRHLPFKKDENGKSWTLIPSKEDGTPLRFQTYFSLSANSLAHHLIKESVKLCEELHHTRELLHQAKMKPDRIKKDGAPEGRPAIAYRGGVPLARDAPTRRRRMSAKEYRELFTDPPTKHC